MSDKELKRRLAQGYKIVSIEDAKPKDTTVQDGFKSVLESLEALNYNIANVINRNDDITQDTLAALVQVSQNIHNAVNGLLNNKKDWDMNVIRDKSGFIDRVEVKQK